VSAGLLISRRLRSRGSQNEEAPKAYLNRFWHLMDEILNTILFVMVGLQTVVLPFVSSYVLIGIMTAFLAIVARSLSIILPSLLVFRLSRLQPGSLRILTWAGLRGGISVALALSLPDSSYRDLILVCCYCIVLFSIIVQGLTIKKLVISVVSRTTRGVTG